MQQAAWTKNRIVGDSEMKLNNMINILLFAFAGAGLGACGGGGGGTPQSTTGVSMGTITGFGSVFVNGVRFNTDNAEVFRGDDQVNDVRDLAIGMRVSVEGDLDNARADRVRFEEDVKGPADAAASGNSFSVMGQTILTDATTLFNNTSLTSIVAGDILEISGLRNANDDIVARFVEKKNNPVNVNRYSVIGNVRALDSTAKTFRIDELIVNYATANVNDLTGGNPVEGQLVEIKDDNKSYVPNSLNLTATKVEPQNRLGDNGIAAGKVEIESIVTRVNSTTEFEIGGITVRTSSATSFLFGTASNIVVGVRLEVEGSIDSNGFMQASKVKFEDNDTRIQAQVDPAGVGSSTVTLLGIPVTVSTDTDMEDNRDGTSPFTLGNIQAGDYLEIRGFLGANSTFIATEIKRESTDSKVEIRGPASAKDDVAGTVTILGLTVNTNGGTQFEGLNDQALSASQFFSAITEGLTVVQAKWDPFSDVSAAVKEMELED
jgi:hypothetical protein